MAKVRRSKTNTTYFIDIVKVGKKKWKKVETNSSKTLKTIEKEIEIKNK